jgi:thiol-disulfide isomerase/thioredoxin
MLMGEHSNETNVESTQWCPNCGASLEDAGAPRPEAAPDTPTCELCGAPLVALQTNYNPELSAVPPVQPTAPPRRSPVALVVVALVAAGMLYFGFHMARPSGTERRSGVLAYGTPAPDFTLETLDGKSVSLSSLRGKAVVVNFWATWCGPCKIETPWLVEMQNQYGAQGLQIVGVAMDDSGKDEIARFAKNMGMNYPVALGKEAVGDAYGGVSYLPESFFVGRDGKIVDKIMGLEGRSEIEDAIKKALNTQAGSPATVSALIGPK